MSRIGKGPMVGGIAVESARSVFDETARKRGVSGRRPAPAEVLPVFEEFARIGFDVPDTADTDLLLYEYGVFSLTGSPLFTVGLVRQFEICDEWGEHEGYVQFRCEFGFEPEPELAALGNRTHCGVLVEGRDLVTDWVAAVRDDADWAVVAHQIATLFAINPDEV